MKTKKVLLAILAMIAFYAPAYLLMDLPFWREVLIVMLVMVGTVAGIVVLYYEN